MVAASSHWDVVECDAASNRGIDDVRHLVSRAAYTPLSKRKVYIVDEAHGLTATAWDALLKTLEEPPPHLTWIFCTTKPEQLPSTVISRCLSFKFRPIETKDVVARLATVARKERASVSPAGLRFIAETSGGNLRYSLTLLEQTLSLNGKSPNTRQVKEVVAAAQLF